MNDFFRHAAPSRASIAGLMVIVAAAAVAVAGSRSFAGSWNDASRLATVECLVDYRTFRIDRSVFVQVPRCANPAAPQPYPADAVPLLRDGTLDKLFIDGHYYSDKPPVPAVLMAVLYKGIQLCTGITARSRPDHFCYWMTLATSGLAYVMAVWIVFLFSRLVGVALSWCLCLAASLALATVALPYSRHVNGHILLLALACGILYLLAADAESRPYRGVPWRRLLGLGTLAGLGYTVELVAGPLLLGGVAAVVLYRRRSLAALALLLIGALPWLALHHAVNYSISGTLIPANAHPEFFQWPGSPFHAGNMTGLWNHPHAGRFFTYAAELLVGKRGFLGHNLPLLLAVTCGSALVQRRVAEFPEICFAMFWSCGTWLVCSLSSNNYSGACCSVRWFVPLLAPGYFVLAILLRGYPRYRFEFLILSGWGIVLAGIMWSRGPWIGRMVPWYWPLQAVALASWMACRVIQRRRPCRATDPPKSSSTPLLPSLLDKSAANAIR